MDSLIEHYQEITLKANLGTTDRIIRSLLGIALLALLFILDGSVRYVGLIGVVLIVTAFIRFCPIYALLGMRTTPAPDPKS